MEDNAEYRKIIEAALFMSPNAMSVNDITKATGIMSPGIIEKLIAELMSEYDARDTSLKIMGISGKYMFSLKDEYISKVSSLASGPDISRGALRILAYISKNEGAIQSDLVKYFGSSTYDYMKELEEKEFVEAKKYKRSKKLSVTPKFNEYFSI
ncbi:MAG: SMC-Scp complex subunit ScpB [Candidatus Micrarchaeaceae archaeon]